MSKTAAYAKFVTRIAVQIGTGTIVRNVVTKNVEPKNKAEEAGVFVASYAIGGVVAEQAGQFTDQQIDEIDNFVRELLAKKSETDK